MASSPDHYNAFVDKQLHGQCFREIYGQVDKWAWLAHSGFAPEIEGFTLQEQTVSTDLIKCSTYMWPVSPSCWLCHNHDEFVDHLASQHVAAYFLFKFRISNAMTKLPAAFIHRHLASDAV